MIRTRTLRYATPLLAIGAILATTAAGCGSSGQSGTTTHTTIKGDPNAAKKCNTTLTLLHPVDMQVSATYTVTCNFPVASADVRLVIQGRPLGSGNTSWDNISNPKTGSSIPITLTYKTLCITALEYQASGSVDALGTDGSPFSTSDTAGPKSYGPSECSSGK
jgi:hypothetical protein